MNLNDLSLNDKFLAVLGFTNILANMVNDGLDPLVDTDVKDYMLNYAKSEELPVDNIDAEVATFYELYDFVLNA